MKMADWWWWWRVMTVVVVVEVVVVMAALAVAATRWCFFCIARAPHLFHIVSFVIQAATDNNHRALALPPRLISICPRLRALIYARRLSFACVRACDERVRVIAEPIHGHSLGYSLTRPRNMCSRWAGRETVMGDRVARLVHFLRTKIGKKEVQ